MNPVCFKVESVDWKEAVWKGLQTQMRRQRRRGTDRKEKQKLCPGRGRASSLWSRAEICPA